MRWLLGRGPGTCHACGADLDRGAVWCGGCGAHAAEADAGGARDVAEHPGPGVAPGDEQHHGSGRRRWGAVAVVVVLLALVGAGLLRTPPPEPLLGMAGNRSGLSATGGPPAALRLAWSQELAAPDLGTWTVSGPVHVVADRDLVSVDGRVVDTADGRLVRIANRTASTATPEAVEVRDGTLVVVEALTGRVADRVALPADAGLPDGAASARSGDVSVLSTGESGTALVRDDGTVVATLDASHLAWVDRALASPTAVPVRRVGSDDPSMATDVTLVALDDGRVVAELPATGQQVVDVVGDRALVARTSDELAGPGQTTPWEVELRDAVSGTSRWSTALPSSEAPRLLGTLPDGTALVAGRSGRRLVVWAVDTTGEPRVLREAVSSRSELGDRFFHGDSLTLSSVGMTDDVVVLLDGAEDRLVAVDGTGELAWQAPVADAWAIGVGDGHVAVLPEDSSRPTQVVRAADGTTVASIPAHGAHVAGGPLGMTPVALVAGHVGIAPPDNSGAGQAAVGSSLWFDLVDGDTSPGLELLAPEVDVEPGGGDWTLHGLAPRGDTGEVEPVITRSFGRDHLQLLQDGRFTAIDLDLPDEGEVAGYFTAPVGLAGGRLALWAESLEQSGRPATRVVDLDTGEVTVHDGLWGLVLLEDLLVGVSLGPDRRPSTLQGLGPATREVRWSRSLEEHELLPFGGTQRSDHDLLVAADRLEVMALELAGGTTTWRYEADAELGDQAVLAPSHVALATTDGEVLALDRSDGAVRWRTPLGHPVTAMTGAGDDLVIGTADGLVVHLDASGREVQRIAVGTGPVAGVAALGDTVVAIVDGEVVGLRRDGTGVTRQDEVPLR